MLDPWNLQSKILKPGVKETISDVVGEPAQIAPLKKLKRLTELSKHFAFFTPAIIYAKIPLVIDPFVAYSEEKEKQLHLLNHVFEKPIFKGLPKLWNNVLCFLPLDEWEDFKQWFGSVSYYHSESASIFRVRTQQLPICEPNHSIATLGPDLLTVIAFVLDTNLGSWYFDPNRKLCDPPSLVFDNNAFLDTKLLAEGLAKTESDPFHYVEQKLKAEEEESARSAGTSIINGCDSKERG